jgi:dienelactone hydrolase
MRHDARAVALVMLMAAGPAVASAQAINPEIVYTLVAPMRRGRGESSGAYVEECSVYVGQSTVPEQTAMATPALREALLDTNTVIDQLVLGKLVPKDSKMIAAGISRGGFLSLMLAAERPTQIKGIVNFVGGWLGVTDRLAAEDIKARMDLHQLLLTNAAQKTKAPTVWFYGARDPFYTEGIPRQWFEIWQKAGGRGEFVFIDDPSLPTGHTVAPNINLWQKQVDAMLKSLELVTQ